MENDKKHELPKGLPLGDLEKLRDLVGEYEKNPNLSTELFFSVALIPYYSPMWEGLDQQAGDVIYVLSEFVPEEKRRTMYVYPSSTGSLLEEDVKWDSLEDWRAERRAKRGEDFIQDILGTLPELSELSKSMQNRLTSNPGEFA